MITWISTSMTSMPWNSTVRTHAYMCMQDAQQISRIRPRSIWTVSPDQELMVRPSCKQGESGTEIGSDHMTDAPPSVIGRSVQSLPGESPLACGCSSQGERFNRLDHQQVVATPPGPDEAHLTGSLSTSNKRRVTPSVVPIFGVPMMLFATSATAQTSYFYPSQNGGFSMFTPGVGTSYAFPNGNGGYSSQTPNRGTAYVNPTGNGGYSIYTPPPLVRSYNPCVGPYCAH